MIKFDLEKALKGEPVVLRNGFKAYVRHRETELEPTPLLLGFYLIGDSFGVGQWAECGANYWSIGETDYDIAGMWIEPPKFEYWQLLNGDIKYLAKDSDGRWFGYKIKPFIGKFKRWDVADHVCYPLSSLNPSLFPECNWDNSLIQRPEMSNVLTCLACGAEKQEPAAMEWCWRMDWLKHNGFNPADPFLWDRSGQAYAKHVKESRT